MKGGYAIGFWIVWALVFVASWIYCIAAYGFLVGVAFGWMAAAVAATVAGALWPVFLLIAALFVYWLLH